MSPTLVVVLLSLLLGLQPAATDLYLPALPAIVVQLDGTIAQAQLTLSGMLLAFGLSQLIWGPVSDRYGRRPVLLLGVSGYAMGALGAALAPTMEWLVIWRILQGAAMGSAVVCGRAIIRDLYAGDHGARVMSKGLSGLGTIACISAPLGSLIAAALGWRAAMSVLVVLGVATLAMVAWRLDETLKQPDPRALQPGPMARNWLQILRHPTFWAFTLLAATSYGALFTVLATSSFVMIDIIGVSQTAYGLQMATMSGCYIVGTVLCRRLLLRLGVQRTVILGGALSLTGGVLLAALTALGYQTAWSVLLPIYIVILGHGIHQPCGQSGAVSPFPRAAGVAAALSGCLMTLTAFGTGLWLGQRMDGTVHALAYGIGFWGVVTALVAWGPVQWLGRARP